MFDKIVIGFLILWVFTITGLGWYRQHERNNMVAECQATLPRYSYCELVAVPLDNPR